MAKVKKAEEQIKANEEAKEKEAVAAEEAPKGPSKEE